nr:uncharacterized protein LOC104112677 [Nicotiana tomentosiformis]
MSDEKQKSFNQFGRLKHPNLSGVESEDAQDFLEQCQWILSTTVFIDVILVYSRSKEDYVQHLRREKKLHDKSFKCEFLFDVVALLRHVDGRVIAYASQQLKVYKKNYHMHDLELEIIIHALKICRYLMYGVPCEVYTDHRSLQHMFKHKDLNLWKRRWLDLLKD